MRHSIILVDLGFVPGGEVKALISEVETLGYIKLQKIEKVLQMWNELEREVSYLAVWRNEGIMNDEL